MLVASRTPWLAVLASIALTSLYGCGGDSETGSTSRQSAVAGNGTETESTVVLPINCTEALEEIQNDENCRPLLGLHGKFLFGLSPWVPWAPPEDAPQADCENTQKFVDCYSKDTRVCGCTCADVAEEGTCSNPDETIFTALEKLVGGSTTVCDDTKGYTTTKVDDALTNTCPNPE